MIEQKLQTPALNTIVVHGTDAIFKDEQGVYRQFPGMRGIDYCIGNIEQRREIAFSMSPFNRKSYTQTDPYVQDTREAEVLKGSLIIVRDKTQLDFVLPIGRSVMIPDLAAFTNIAAALPARDNNIDDPDRRRPPPIISNVQTQLQEVIDTDHAAVAQTMRLRIREADYVIIDYRDMLALSAVLQQQARQVSDLTEQSMLAHMQNSLRFNAFGMPEMKSIVQSLALEGGRSSNRMLVMSKVLQVRGLIFKHVVYHQLSREQLKGSVLGQVHYVTLLGENARTQGSRVRRLSGIELVADLVTHQIEPKRNVIRYIGDDAMTSIKAIIKDIPQDSYGGCLIKDSLTDLYRFNQLAVIDLQSQLRMEDVSASRKLPIQVHDMVTKSVKQQTYRVGDDVLIPVITRDSITATYHTNSCRRWEVSQMLRALLKTANLTALHIFLQYTERIPLLRERPQKGDASLIEQRLQEACIVCMDHIKVGIIVPCTHVLCSACFAQLENSQQCPMCRGPYAFSECNAVKMQEDEQPEQDPQVQWGLPQRSVVDAPLFEDALKKIYSECGREMIKRGGGVRLLNYDDLTTPYQSELTRMHLKMKRILIPVFSSYDLSDRRSYSEYQVGGWKRIQNIVVNVSVDYGSAIEFITVSRHNTQVKPTSPIVFLFIEDESVLLDSYIMNEGLRDVFHAIVPPGTLLQQYGKSEFSRRLTKAGISQTLFRDQPPYNRRTIYID